MYFQRVSVIPRNAEVIEGVTADDVLRLHGIRSRSARLFDLENLSDEDEADASATTTMEDIVGVDTYAFAWDGANYTDDLDLHIRSVKIRTDALGRHWLSETEMRRLGWDL